MHKYKRLIEAAQLIGKLKIGRYYKEAKADMKLAEEKLRLAIKELENA